MPSYVKICKSHAFTTNAPENVLRKNKNKNRKNRRFETLIFGHNFVISVLAPDLLSHLDILGLGDIFGSNNFHK